MIKSIFITLVIFNIAFFVSSFAEEKEEKNVFCYYDSRSFFREDLGKVTLQDIQPALSQCTHLVYGYAAVSSIDFKMIPLNRDLDVGTSHKYYTKVNDLKKNFPELKVLLSVGGGADQESPGKYLKLLESTEARNNFKDSVLKTLLDYGFDGVDLAWQFPPDKPKRKHSTLGNIWSSIKQTFRKEKSVDEKYVEHAEQFKQLVRDLSYTLKGRNLIITASVLPNVNSLMFFNYYALMIDLDYIILHTYDFFTPERFPKLADHSSPLKQPEDRLPDMNADAIVSDWLLNFFPTTKIILGIPTFGRAWKIYSDCTPNGNPPVRADGPAAEGAHTSEKGLLAYYEICNKIVEDEETDVKYLARMYDANNKCGAYAFKTTFKENDFGIWISYEDPEDVAEKITYLKDKKLSGVAIVDLSLDDYKGVCNSGKFPLLMSAVSHLKS